MIDAHNIYIDIEIIKSAEDFLAVLVVHVVVAVRVRIEVIGQVTNYRVQPLDQLLLVFFVKFLPEAMQVADCLGYRLRPPNCHLHF